MDKNFFEILVKFRPCFSRKATFYWFTLFMIGLVVRGDHYGVSSIVRWLNLAPAHYWSVLHFFLFHRIYTSVFIILLVEVLFARFGLCKDTGKICNNWRSHKSTQRWPKNAWCSHHSSGFRDIK